MTTLRTSKRSNGSPRFRKSQSESRATAVPNPRGPARDVGRAKGKVQTRDTVAPDRAARRKSAASVGKDDRPSSTEERWFRAAQRGDVDAVGKGNEQKDDPGGGVWGHELDDVGPQPLERGWVFWVHRPCFEAEYEATREPLHSETIRTVQDLWRHLNNIPPPSAFFFRDGTRRNVRTAPDREPGPLEGWGCFQEGVSPDWEDPRNRGGSTLTFKAAFSPARIDRVWQNALLAVCGERCPASERVTGVRVIDRGATYRLEVWTDDDAPGTVHELRVFFFRCVVGEALNGMLDGVKAFIASHREDPKRVGHESGARTVVHAMPSAASPAAIVSPSASVSVPAPSPASASTPTPAPTTAHGSATPSGTAPASDGGIAPVHKPTRIRVRTAGGGNGSRAGKRRGGRRRRAECDAARGRAVPSPLPPPSPASGFRSATAPVPQSPATALPKAARARDSR